MTEVQRFRQSGYDNKLHPSSNEGDAHFMFYKDHVVVAGLLREMIADRDSQIEMLGMQNKRLLNIIDRIIEEQRSN